MPKMDHHNGDESPRERLSISVRDLDRVPTDLRYKLLRGPDGRPRLSSEVVFGGRDRDESVVFCCDLLEAAIVCDIIRSHDRERGDEQTGVYIQKREAWPRVLNDLPLTIAAPSGKRQLNPKVFDVEHERVPHVGERIRPVDF